MQRTNWQSFSLRRIATEFRSVFPEATTGQITAAVRNFRSHGSWRSMAEIHAEALVMNAEITLHRDFERRRIEEGW